MTENRTGSDQRMRGARGLIPALAAALLFAHPGLVVGFDEAVFVARLAEQRAVVRASPRDEAARQALAEMAIELAMTIERLDLAQSRAEGDRLGKLLATELPDTRWRVGYMARKGDGQAALALAVMSRRGIIDARDSVAACMSYRLAATLGASVDAARSGDCDSPDSPGTPSPAQSPAVGERAGDPLPQKKSELEIPESLAARLEAQEAVGDTAGMREIVDRLRAIDATGLSALTERAARGSIDARRTLGTLYRLGIAVRLDAATACGHYARISDADPTARYHSGLCVAGSDRERALTLLESAAGDGHAAAQELVARACLQRADNACARRNLLASASAGRRSAHALLGWMHANGTGVERDFTVAARHYRFAADTGDPVAQNNLAGLIENGQVPGATVEDAFAWYRRAAEAGLPEAQMNVGRLYASGRGTPLDVARARGWLERAARAGTRGAAEMLDSLAAGPATAPPDSAAGAGSLIFHTRARLLNVRAGPGVDAEIVGRVRAGKRLVEVARQGDWIKVGVVIRGEETLGWVHRDYVSPGPPSGQ